MRTLSERHQFPGKFLSAIFVCLLALHPLYAQFVTTTIAVGVSPEYSAVNPVTNMIYQANEFSNTVTVINGATSTVAATLSVGITPAGVAVNPETNTIYVANNGSNTVTVINGATNAITTSVPVGANPLFIAINPVTDMIYVVNSAGNTVSVISGATNAVTATINVGTNPWAVAVNPVTGMIYVPNYGGNNVSVINGASNKVTATIAAGTRPWAVAINPITNMIYVTNTGSANVTVINGATNAASTVVAGTSPYAIAVNPVTNMIYTTNEGSNNVTVINGATNAVAATVAVGTTPVCVAVNPLNNEIYVGNNTSSNVSVIAGATNTVTATIKDANALNVRVLAVNPITDKIYVANFGSNNVSVIDGSTYATQTFGTDALLERPAVDPSSGWTYVPSYSSDELMYVDGYYDAALRVGYGPVAAVVNPVTEMVYVTNNISNDISIVNGATFDTQTVLSTGLGPACVGVNPVTNKIYICNFGVYGGTGPAGSNDVTVLNGATLATQTVATGSAPVALAVNPVTDEIYVADCGAGCYYGTGNGSVTVINGATNTSTTITDPKALVPYMVAVNPATNMVYVANSDSDNVTVINGATNSVTTTVTLGISESQTYPLDLVVNPVTNMIYAVTWVGGLVAINGATNTPSTINICNYGCVLEPTYVDVNVATNKIYVGGQSKQYGDFIAVIDGATSAVNYIPAGEGPNAIAVNAPAGLLYATNYSDETVSVIAEQQVQTIPLTTVITPLTGNVTASATPTFNFTAASSFTPTNTTPQAVWYQFDTWQGTWLRASGMEPNFTGTAPTLLAGQHILYAFATDGQDATSTGAAQGLIGNITSYVFAVTTQATAPPKTGCKGRICVLKH